MLISLNEIIPYQIKDTLTVIALYKLNEKASILRSRNIHTAIKFGLSLAPYPVVTKELTHMNKLEYRHEYKHAINLLDYYTLRQRVRAVSKVDPNAGVNGRYHIRSLYFDNDDDKALREKIYGLPNREKFRIRLYNIDDAFIRLEKKSKVNGLCNKQSIALSREQTQQILDGDILWMADSVEPLIVEFFSKMRFQRLRPRTIVDYWREAYIFPYGNVRVTFDSDIRTGLYSTGLFDINIPTLSVGEPGVLLLEVKYDNFIPDLMRDIIQTNTRHTEAFSKYAACRIYG